MKVGGSRIRLSYTSKPVSRNVHFRRCVSQREVQSCICAGFCIALHVQRKCAELKKPFLPFSPLAILRGPG